MAQDLDVAFKMVVSWKGLLTEETLAGASFRSGPKNSSTTPAQLEIWSDRVLEAKTLQEVFGSE